MKTTRCATEGCDRDRIARGLCSMHYKRLMKLGPLPPIVALTQCTVDGCDRGGGIVRGMCSVHYDRVRLHGTTDAPHRPSVAERLADGLVRMPNGCLEWTGETLPKMGYGRIKVGGKNISTHRLAWELANGPIPDGLFVLHHCDNPPCCDAEKCLFLGTGTDNMADKIAKGRDHWLNVTHCPQGHPYDETNTYVTPRGHRQCRTCRHEVMDRYWKEHPRGKAA